MITKVETGMTNKKKLYSELHRAGYLLPAFSSGAVTMEALMRKGDNQFLFPTFREVAVSLKKKLVLNAPVGFAYECIQNKLFAERGKTMPYENCPDRRFVAIMVDYLDPTNQLELLQTTWKSSFDSHIVLQGGRYLKYVPPQGQAQQAKIDQLINQTTKARNALIWSNIQRQQLDAEFEQNKKDVKALPTKDIDEFTDALLRTTEPLKIEEQLAKLVVGDQIWNDYISEMPIEEQLGSDASEREEADDSRSSSLNQTFEMELDTDNEPDRLHNEDSFELSGLGDVAEERVIPETKEPASIQELSPIAAPKKGFHFASSSAQKERVEKEVRANITPFDAPSGTKEVITEEGKRKFILTDN